MIEVIANQSDNILTFTAHGQVTGQDYESVLIPAVEAKLKEHRKRGFCQWRGCKTKAWT